MKYFYTLLVVFILFVFPLITWLFLRNGESYLVDVIDEIIIVQDSLDAYSFLAISEGKIDTIKRENLDGLALVIFHENDYSKLKEGFSKVDKQYSGATHLQFLQLYDDSPRLDLSNDFVNDVRTFKDINHIYNTFNGHQFIISDTKGYIRSYYKSETPEYIKLVKHLGILLPPIARGK